MDTRTVGKVVHKGKTLTFAGGACKRPSTPAGTYVATLGVVSTANPARTKSLTITIKRPKGGRTYRNPAAVVSWRISIAGLWVFNPGVVKLSRDLKSGSFSGTVTTGLGQNAGKGSGSWKCGSVT
ncbi:MAG TPA: hypothetical protein VFR32_01690 [Gaiellaceae bacterium]|nr:hypothetical protein [Gaiellaceae bacterium]